MMKSKKTRKIHRKRWWNISQKQFCFQIKIHFLSNENKSQKVPCGLVVRISRSHRDGPGSIPGVGNQFFNFLFAYLLHSNFQFSHGRISPSFSHESPPLREFLISIYAAPCTEPRSHRKWSKKKQSTESYWDHPPTGSLSKTPHSRPKRE